MQFKSNSEFDESSYVKVNTRLLEFWTKYPEGRLDTNAELSENGTLIIKASLYRNANDTAPAATGHAFLEDLSGEKVGEYTETVAVGRALALMGFKIEKSIASGEEMNRFQQRQEAKKTEVEADPDLPPAKLKTASKFNAKKFTKEQ